MVWPQHVIQISVLDLISCSTRGAPVMSMCLCWETTEHNGQTSGCWKRLRKMPLAAMTSPVFAGSRDDKTVNRVDLRLSQATDLVEVSQVDLHPSELQLPKSEVIRRAVYTKVLKGQTMVRKLLMWATNKQAAGSGQSADGTANCLLPAADFPAFVVHVTDYSPGRAEPLQRDIRVSNSREQIDQLWDELVKEKVVKGWISA
jgi:hypothetical protein